MFSFFNTNSDEFQDNFLNDYSKLIYFNIRKTFNYYSFYFEKNELDDCFQTIILKIYSKKENIFSNYNEEKSKFTTYLSVICTNTTIDFLNDNKDKYNFKEESENLFIEDLNIENQMEIDRIFKKSTTLSDKEKLVIKLFYFKEMTSPEIADFLSINESTVRVMKKNGIDKIKKELL